MIINLYLLLSDSPMVGSLNIEFLSCSLFVVQCEICRAHCLFFVFLITSCKKKANKHTESHRAGKLNKTCFLRFSR